MSLDIHAADIHLELGDDPLIFSNGGIPLRQGPRDGIPCLYSSAAGGPGPDVGPLH